MIRTSLWNNQIGYIQLWEIKNMININNFSRHVYKFKKLHPLRSICTRDCWHCFSRCKLECMWWLWIFAWVFHKPDNIGIRGFATHMKTKNYSSKMLPPVRIELRTSGVLIWWFPFWANLALLVSLRLYCHTLLILTKSSKSKNQVVYEQKTV